MGDTDMTAGGPNSEGDELNAKKECSEGEPETTSTVSDNATAPCSPVPSRFHSPTLTAGSTDDAFAKSSYMRGCKFSPDGLCIAALSDDNAVRLFNVELGEATSPSHLDKAAVTMREAETVYDFCWFPLMDSCDPDTCFVATTSRSQPIHLHDAYDGSIRATFKCINHLDELSSAHSLAFDATGQHLYAGLKNEIRIFDVSVPGRKCVTRKTWSRKTEGGLHGIISCIATNPALSSVYALGSFSRSVGVYLEPRGDLLCLLTGQRGGVTHLQFSPDGNFLLAGGRKDNEILVWDMRNPGSLYCVLPREVSTNQRIYFDVHSDSRHVATGGTDSCVRMFDLSQVPQSPTSPASEPQLQPVWTSATGHLHADCVNGVSFNPRIPDMMATSSGQRHVDQSSDHDSSDDEMELVDRNSSATLSQECMLKLWKLQT